MKIRQIIFLISHILFSIAAIANPDKIKISGYVTDNKSGEILPDANVIIGKQSTVTNNYGYFMLETTPGDLPVKVSFTGYSPYEANWNIQKDTILSVKLNLGIELPEVVLTAENKNIDSKGLGNIRINVAQLRAAPLFLGERDIIKAMQFLPGVSSGMEGSSQLNIRGGTNDQTLYLMDDVPVYNQNHTFGFFSIFNSDALLSAELYKGGIPSLYGDRLSGVANISLKDGNYQKQKTSFTLGTLAGTLALEGPIIKDKLSYQLTARRSFLDLLYNGIMSLASEGSGGGGGMISFYDINGKLSWKINPKTKLSWQAYTGYDDLYGANKENDSYTGEKFSEKFGFGWKTWMTSFKLTSSLSPNLFLSSSLYYTQLSNFDYYKNKQETNTVKNTLENNTSSLLHEIGLRSSLEQKINNRNTLTYGFNISRQQYTPEIMYKKVDHSKITYDSEKLKLFTASVFVNEEYKLDTWVFSAGLRASAYNNTQLTKYVFEPRLKINKYLGDNNKLMAAYDKMHQPVHSLNEMNYNVQTDFWVPFREDTLPSSQQFSLGWKNYSLKNVTFSVEAYYKQLSNLLLIKNIENYLDFHSDFETGSGRSAGLEFMAEYSIPKFSAWLSYTLSKTTRNFDGKSYPFKYDAPTDISAFASYVVRKKEKTLNTFSVNAQYKTGYPYYIPEVSYPSEGLPTLPNGYIGLFNDMSHIDFIPQYPNIRLRNYFRLDLNFTMEQKLKHGSRTWQFSLLNATGRENPYAVYRIINRYKSFVLVPFLPSISFTRYF